jgi:hypothetical protein
VGWKSLGRHDKNYHHHQSSTATHYMFPKMRVPLKKHVSIIFHYKPSIFWGILHLWKPPYKVKHVKHSNGHWASGLRIIAGPAIVFQPTLTSRDERNHAGLSNEPPIGDGLLGLRHCMVV